MARKGSRVAEVAIGARSHLLGPALKKAERKFQRFGKNVDKGMARNMRNVAGSLKGFAGVGAVAGIAAIGRQVFGFERSLLRLNIQARQGKSQLDQTRKAIEEIGLETGLGRDKVLEGAEAFTSLVGASALSADTMRTLARVAQASGAPMGDLAGIAFTLQDTLNIDPKDFEKAFSIILSAGKTGAIQLGELSKELPGLASGMIQFGVQGNDALAQLVAGLQATRAGFKGPSEGVNAMNGLMIGLIDNADEFRKKSFGGIEIFEDKGGVKVGRNLRDIIQDMSKAKLFDDPELLKKVLPRKEGRAMALVLAKNVKAWDSWTDSARQANDVGEDFERVMGSSFGKTEEALARMKQSLAEAVTPELIKSFASAMGSAADGVGAMAGHWQTIAAIWGGSKFVSMVSALTGLASAGALAVSAAGALGVAAGLGINEAQGTRAEGIVNGITQTKGARDIENRINKAMFGDTVDTSNPIIRARVAGNLFDPSGAAARLRERGRVQGRSSSAITADNPTGETGLGRHFRQQAEAIERQGMVNALENLAKQLSDPVRVVIDMAPDGVLKAKKTEDRKKRNKR